MSEYIVMTVSHEIGTFYENASSMYAVDFDIHSVVADYVEHCNAPETLIPKYRDYGSSPDDLEDGKVLYGAVEILYKSLDERLQSLNKPVVRALLSENRIDLLVEVQT